MSEPLNKELAFHVHTYVPDANAEELEHRIALLKARDWAAAMRGQGVTGLALDLACIAHEMSGAFAFAQDETPQRLEMAALLGRRLIGAAMAAETLGHDT